MSRAARARPVQLATALGAGALLLVSLGLTGTAAARPPVRAAAAYDAGIQGSLKLPDPPRPGSRFDVTKFGATKNKDGDDDSGGFRAAIAAAKEGDEVWVPKGTYVFTKDRIELRKGVSIRGEAADSTTITATFTTVTDADDSSIFYAPPTVGNLTLSDLRLTSSGGKALNFPVRLGSASGANVSRIAVRNLRIDKFYKMAISVRNGDNVTVEKNVIKDALATGGGGEGYGVMIGYPNSRNNRVADNVIGPVIRHGVLLQYSAHHNLVEHNRVQKTVYDAYDLHGEDESNNELRNNVATDCGEGGFGVGNTGGTPEHKNAGPKNWIHDNEVSGCKYGIHVYRNSDVQYVEDNNFHDNRSIGISVHDEGARGLVFARNKVQNNANGVQLNHAPDVRFVDNTVTKNKGYALRADSGTTQFVITGNDFGGGEVTIAKKSSGTLSANTP